MVAIFFLEVSSNGLNRRARTLWQALYLMDLVRQVARSLTAYIERYLPMALARIHQIIRHTVFRSEVVVCTISTRPSLDFRLGERDSRLYSELVNPANKVSNDGGNDE